MPHNLNALVRYRAINKCLINGKRASKYELIEACTRAIGKDYEKEKEKRGEQAFLSTLNADLKEMRENGELGYLAPIDFDRTEGKYFYSKKDYSIDKIPLSDDEIQTVLFAAKYLGQMKDVEIFKEFSESAAKLAVFTNIYRNNSDALLKKKIVFEKAVETKGTEFIQDLLTAIRFKLPVTIKYQSFTSEEIKEYIVHPYLLKEYRNRWYLVGLSEASNEIRTFCLDRFRNKPENNTRVSFRNTDFDPNRYFENVIGITVTDEKPMNIEVAFSELQANYLITQPLHKSQKRLPDRDGKVVFRYRLIPNFEFISFIRGLGEEAEVMRPEKLRKLINKDLSRIQPPDS
jgi:predicted DNA-binding transcriptional regulator YafY